MLSLIATNKHPHSHQLVILPSFMMLQLLSLLPLRPQLTLSHFLPTLQSCPRNTRILQPELKESTYIQLDPVAELFTPRPRSSPSRNCPPLNIIICITIFITPTIIPIISQAPSPTKPSTATSSRHTMT